MKTIPLTRGMVALVDDSDFDWLSQWDWHVHSSRDMLYAARSEYNPQTGKIKTVLMHREILKAPSNKLVDHKDRNSMNCQRYNLRITNRLGSSRNRSGWKKKPESNFKGVFFRKDTGKWRAGICVDYKMIWLGQFDSAKDAARAYDARAAKHFGEFAVLNFPNSVNKN